MIPDKLNAHTLPARIHRVTGCRYLMDSDTKEIYGMTEQDLDELCARSNAHAGLVAENARLREALELAKNEITRIGTQTIVVVNRDVLVSARSALAARKESP